ncbi:MAG TPA: hypothetical protein VHL57_04725, partial [Flavobacteriales bacterium]|nr:hypothetical protein [Flavobacteriales bacterium]
MPDHQRSFLFSWPRLAVAALLLVGATVAQAQVDSLSTSTDSTFVVRPDTSTTEQDIRAAGYTISAGDLDAELGGQDVSGILQSSRDVFNATAGFTFGAARFRIRGFDGENTLISLNG